MADNQSNAQVIPWPFIRYTEMVLNYVEACIALGQEDDARTWLNKIRFRAGMPAIEDAGTALRDRCRNERRIELAFEEHRFYDVRRWKIADVTENKPAGGIIITKNGSNFVYTMGKKANKIRILTSLDNIVCCCEKIPARE